MTHENTFFYGDENAFSIHPEGGKVARLPIYICSFNGFEDILLQTEAEEVEQGYIATVKEPSFAWNAGPCTIVMTADKRNTLHLIHSDGERGYKPEMIEAIAHAVTGVVGSGEINSLEAFKSLFPNAPLRPFYPPRIKNPVFNACIVPKKKGAIKSGVYVAFDSIEV